MNWDVLYIVENLLRGIKGLSRNEKQSLYEIVSHALRTTRTIISQTRKDGFDQPSNILSMTWQNASNQLKKLNYDGIRDYAQTLEEKSKYWSDPSGYNKSDLERYGMMLIQVEAKLKDLTK